MTRLAYVDLIGGAAGDMLLAALLDAGADAGAVRDAVERVVPGTFTWGTEDAQRRGLRALHLRVEAADGAPPPPGTSRSMGDLLSAVEAAGLEDPVRATATAVIRRLGEAESVVHGVAPELLHLHELGDDDTLLDVVGVAAALSALGIERLVASTVPLAFGGTVPGRAPHRDIPLPSPATLELLRAFHLRPSRAGGERITPTAAAILSALADPGPEMPPMTLEAIGYGAGSDDPDETANVVRVLVGTGAGSSGAADVIVARELVVLETNLDDLTPELMAAAAEEVRRTGALDVWTTPVVMKRGRPGAILSALCEPASVETVREAYFGSTSTLGVRAYGVSRTELARRTETVVVGGMPVRVKIAVLRGRPLSAKPEHDDVRSVAEASGRAARDVEAEAAAMARQLLWEHAP